MSNVFEAVAGTIVPVRDLANARGREFAGFVDSGASPFARLVSCHAGPDSDIVVHDVDVQLSQRMVHQIAAVERIAVCFDRADRRMPEFLALRTEFPSVPHLLLKASATPKSLCLFDETFAEIRPRWSAPVIIERIRTWLRFTARGELHADDQPLEPILAASDGYLVVPRNLLSGSAGVCGVVRRPDHFGQLVLVLERSITDSAPFVSLVVHCEPREHGVIQKSPRTLADLIDLVKANGTDLLTLLRARLKEVSDHRPLFAVPMVLVVAFPKRRNSTGPTETIDAFAFLTLRSIKEIGEALGVWKMNGNEVGFLLSPDPSQKGQDIAVNVLNVLPTIDRQLAATMNGLDPKATSPKLVGIGMGALGSQVVLNLVRSGFGDWTAVDRDVLWPHNNARHALDGHSIGMPKAQGVAMTAASILDGTPIVTPIVADVLEPGPREEELTAAFQSADVIVDLSASIVVARHLARGDFGAARRISAFLNPTGTDFVMIAEDKARSVNLEFLELQYYRAIATRSELDDHLREPAGRIRYGRSCRDVSARISQETVALHSAIAARALRETLTKDCAAIRVWRTDSGYPSGSSIEIGASPVHCLTSAGWTVCFDEIVKVKMEALRADRLPNETGGVLVGRIDMDRRTVAIVDVVPSPPDSDEWPTSYIRGHRGLIQSVQAISDATAGQLCYVGEWHTHPDGYPANPSDDDLNVLAWLTERMCVDGLPGVIMIVAQQETRAYVGTVVSVP